MLFFYLYCQMKGLRVFIDRPYCPIQLTLQKATDHFHVPRQSLDSCESRKKGKVAIFGEDNKDAITLRH